MAKTKDTTNSVSVKPIIFSGEMVRALLEGRKTQTRRVMKMPACGSGLYTHPKYGLKNSMGGSVPDAPYNVGDLLWVRETWSHTGQGVWKIADVYQSLGGDIVYRADEDGGSIGYFPSIHMPRWASRLTLRVTNVRAERLQDISEDDARAEGCSVQWSGDMNEGPDKFADEVFTEVWEALYPKDSPKAWHRNPWVWVYEFEVIRKNVGEVS